MIDKWIGKTISKKGILRFVKNDIIKIEECTDYDKISPQWNLPHEKNEKSVFDVKNKNPMFDYYSYTGEAKVGECEVCGNPYIVIGNTKTCCDTCSENLKFRNN